MNNIIILFIIIIIIVMTECFICCNSKGKSEQEILEELFLNRQTHNYPLITMAHAYGCNCTGSIAHNKCLRGIKKCPTCRKNVTKPNLYVGTRYDFWFGPLFNIIRSNLWIISKIKIYFAISMGLFFGLHLLIEKKYIIVDRNLQWKISFGLMLLIQLGTGIVLLMEDYFKKYWLYNEQTQTIGI